MTDTSNSNYFTHVKLFHVKQWSLKPLVTSLCSHNKLLVLSKLLIP